MPQRHREQRPWEGLDRWVLAYLVTYDLRRSTVGSFSASNLAETGVLRRSGVIGGYASVLQSEHRRYNFLVSTAPIHPLAPDNEAKLGTDFEKQVFNAGLLSLEQVANPLRLNHFATTLRELSRIVLKRLAPDAQTKACGWYVQAQGQAGITRAQRITYAVHAGVLDGFVRNTLQLDVDKMRRDLLKAVDELSKYTHIEPAVFGITGRRLKPL